MVEAAFKRSPRSVSVRALFCEQSKHQVFHRSFGRGERQSFESEKFPDRARLSK